MTVPVDTPDWSGGASNRAGFDQVDLGSAFSVPAGGVTTLQIPAGGAPIHALGLYAAGGSQNNGALLQVVGHQSGIRFYSGYFAGEIFRTGRAAVIPFSNLYDTAIDVHAPGLAASGLWLWGYTQAVPPAGAVRRAAIQAISVLVASGVSTAQALPPMSSNQAYAIYGAHVTYGGTAANIITVQDTNGVAVGAMLVAPSSYAALDLHGIVLGENVGVNVHQSQTTPGATVYLQYAIANTPDGSDL